MKAQKYIVTTSFDGKKRTRLWESSRPMALDHPFQWVIEKTESGVRVRELGPKLAKVIKITPEQARKGSQVELDREKAILCEVKEIPEMTREIWKLHSLTKGEDAQKAKSLFVYTAIRGFVLAAEAVMPSFTARTAAGRVFKVRKIADGVLIRAYQEGVVLHTPAGQARLHVGDARQVKKSDLDEIAVSYKKYHWHFAHTAQAVPVPQVREEDREIAWFWKALAGLTASFLFFIIVGSLLTPPEEEAKKPEVVPERYAKFILRAKSKTDSQTELSSRARGVPQEKLEQASQKGGAEAQATRDASKPEALAKGPANPSAMHNVAKQKSSADAAAAAKARGEARTKALQNLMSGIMKSGVSSLTKEKNLIAAAASGQSGAAAAGFQARAGGGDSLDVSNIGSAMSEVRPGARVGMMGGHGAGGTDKNGNVGYGGGVHASLGRGAGGTSDVSLDPGSAIMDEGLTKEEVYAVIYKHMSEVRYCYEAAMLGSQKLEGKLNIDFRINASGVVDRASGAKSSTSSRKLDDCVVRRLMTWKFPKPKGGVNVNVSYPFIFKTLGGA